MDARLPELSHVLVCGFQEELIGILITQRVWDATASFVGDRRCPQLRCIGDRRTSRTKGVSKLLINTLGLFSFLLAC